MIDFLHSNSLLDDTTIADTARHLLPLIETFQGTVDSGGYTRPESSLNVADDAAIIEAVNDVVTHKTSPALKYIIVIGIGGSNLAAKALYDAFYGSFDILRPQRFPKMIFLDTCDSEYIQALQLLLQEQVHASEEILINLISKSGSTTESVVNAEIIIGGLLEVFPSIMDRVVVTTDEGSALFTIAASKGIATLGIPHLVGGRFSVLTAVGCFPLACAGVDIKALLAGALTMRDQCLNRDVTHNPAALSATILYLHHGLGRTIHDLFLFHPELESLGKWYRQLLGESIGKEKDLEEEIVHTGITPTVSIGSTDLHSVGQLYLAGPDDKLTTFLSVTSLPDTFVRVPDNIQFSGLIEHIKGRSPQEIMNAIMDGIKITYGKRQRPFMEVMLHDISAQSLGAFMQWKIMEIMYLGHLLNINPFDQPNVEEYKMETRNILLHRER